MAKMILNNVLTSGNETEAFRDGYYAHRPDGRLEIQQTLLAAVEAAKDKAERLSSFASDGLRKGGSVEVGALDAGLFVERDYNYSREFLAAFAEKLTAMGVDVEALKTSVKDSVGAKHSGQRFRIFDTGEKTKGERLAPTVDGSPVPAPEKKGAE